MAKSEPKDLPSFQKMWDNYPIEGAETVATNIGGKVADNVLPSLGTDKAWNTCTIRLSRSFNYSGDPIPEEKHLLVKAADKRPLRVVSGADGYKYAYGVEEMAYYLEEVYGPADGTFSIDKASPDALGSSQIAGQRVLVVFQFMDATNGKPRRANHADLWDGANMRYNNVVTNPKHSSFTIKYWEFAR